MEEVPNYHYIDKLAKGDELFRIKLLNVIKKELSTEIEAYHMHLKNKDFNKTAESVHKLSHKISILGLEKGYKTAKEYEIDLLKENLDQKVNFERILEAMLHFAEKL